MLSVPVSVLARQKASGTLFNTYTTAKSMLNADAKLPLPKNFLSAGRYLRVTALLGISNKITSQPTFTFQLMVGAVVAWSSGAVLADTTAHVIYPAKLVIDVRVDAEGSGTGGKLIAVGELSGKMFVISGAVADPTLGIGKFLLPDSGIAQGTGFNFNAENVLDFWVGISASDAANGCQVFNYVVEDLSADRGTIGAMLATYQGA